MIAVRDLSVSFGGRRVAHVPTLDLAPGELVGLAGESGSGKSMTSMAILGLAPALGASVTGSVKLQDRELLGLPEKELLDLRGRRIAMVMQSPRGSLNPTMRLGKLMEKTLATHGIEKADARERTAAALADVRLDEELLRRYPHQVSGGQAQRFAIALAVAMRAEVLLADEPTSALDVTVQAEVLDTLNRLRAEHGTAILLVSHDLAVLGRYADRLVVMRSGEVVEQGVTRDVLTSPTTDYTRELVAAVPVIGASRPQVSA